MWKGLIAVPTVLTVFRVVAIAEAVSWVGLLIGMFFKYVVVENEVGVQVFGPVHGGLFVVYLVGVLVAGRSLRWSVRDVVIGVVCSVPPLATLWFERRMVRRYAAARAGGQELVASRS